MIISMCKILCITNRKLCKGDFLSRLSEIAEQKPAGIVLREKDLSEAEYAETAGMLLKICRREHVPCILHSHTETASALHADFLHLPLPLLHTISSASLPFGVSCHSAEDARTAVQAGASYLIAGHIFDTDCKKGLPGRGIGFLKEVCDSVSVPVYAIGGISPENAGQVIAAGAAGICVMSGLMQCSSPAEYIKKLKEGICNAV